MGFGRAAIGTSLVCAAAWTGLLAPDRLLAQDYFGQNQVEYRHFQWRVLETEHFRLHYYPAERAAAWDAARMAERDYGRLSRLLDHQFREKKPILLFASRADFGQNNVTGDLGEGVGGVTEAERDRIILPLTGDYRSFEHVLAHEMTHEFQYDIFGRGRAGGGLQVLAQVDPPLWFMEGMAEYLSLGPRHALTASVMRDAVLNGHMPTIEQMTRDPGRFFPYRYGEALWAYVGERWGDEAIGEIMAEVPAVGVERAFHTVLGMSLADLSDDWRRATEARYLPAVPDLERARTFARPILTPRRTGGSIFIAPALSSDGRYIAFIATGSFVRGEVFPDLWLGDARTGKRIERLVRSTTDPNYAELNLLYSQNAFSPDGRYLAFTALTGGHDVLYLFDLRRDRVVRRFRIPVDVSSPAFAPDGRTLVFSGMTGGITDLYTVEVASGRVRRLTDDRHGDLQPQWSPDGRTIAFASDRGDGASLQALRLPKWRICLYDLATGQITVLPDQEGLNLNPMWSPDGDAIAYISDRTGTANVYLYDLVTQSQSRLTNVVGAVSAFTEYSPAITWARAADRLAFTYYENDRYLVWGVDHPRALHRTPMHDLIATVEGAAATGEETLAAGIQPPLPSAGGSGTGSPSAGTADRWRTLAHRGSDSGASDGGRSFYRSPSGAIRSSDSLGDEAVTGSAAPPTVAALLDSTSVALPDSAAITDHPYRAGFHADYIAQPSIGYGANNYYSGVYGGTTVVLSDLVGDQHLAVAGQLNGRFSDAELFADYTNLGHRLQYSTGLYQVPYYYYSSDRYLVSTAGVGSETLQLTRDVIRQAFAVGIYPLDRFLRWELGSRFTNLDRSIYFISRPIDVVHGGASTFSLDSIRGIGDELFAQPFVALVGDNALFGTTGPIAGHRFRFEVQPAVGSKRWTEYVADVRRYVPVLFDYLTLATRFFADVKTGRDELYLPAYIASPYLLRGYDRAEGYYTGCDLTHAESTACSLVQTLGSRVLVANAELRFPVLRRADLRFLPLSLPPLDGVIFGDAGVAWSKDQTLYGSRPANYNLAGQRYPLTSYGAGIRVNLYNLAILRWDYAIPIDAGHHGYWRWSVGPDF